MIKLDNTKFTKTLTEQKIVPRALPPDNSSYFCKYDELSGIMACPNVVLRPLNDSCYRTREEVFAHIHKERNTTSFVKKIGSPKYKTR